MFHVQCLIFDLDYTIADTSVGIVTAFNGVLQNRGLPIVQDSTIRSWIGKDHILDQYRRAVPNAENDLLNDLFEEYLSRFRAVAPASSKLMPKAAKVLRYYDELGKLLALATIKTSEISRLILESLDILRHFDLVAGSTEVKNSKPDPEVVSYVFRKLHVGRKQTAIIGDHPNDIRAGRAAGIGLTIGIATGNHSTQELASCYPDHVIESLEDMQEIVS